LDLRSWRVAFNGSEPVHPATLERFAEAFGPCGFRRQAFRPVYGLAEATLMVTSDEIDKPPRVESFSSEALENGRAEPVTASGLGRALVSCGHPWGGTEIVIANPDTRAPCAGRQVGEIWVRGPSVGDGYWGKDAETSRTFHATTLDGEGPFLRTGDLGFMADGDLFVTGRHKDLIIVRGRNHYPQDIEASVSTCHPALVPGGGAAFSLEGAAAERLVIVQEVARTALRTLDVAEVVRAVRRAVSEDHGLQTHALVLVKPSTLPRTSSGKLRRSACRQDFLNGSLSSVASWVGPATEPNTDANPDSERRRVSARADLLIEWLWSHPAALVSSYSAAEQRTISTSLLRDLAHRGLLGALVEPAYGGLGLGHLETARVLEELAVFDFGLALFIGFNNYLGIQPVAKYGSAQLRALLLPGLVQGRELAAFALEEPGTRGRRLDLTTKAEADGDGHWRLFGAKCLDGAAHGASIINVFVRHGEPPGISAFCVREGIEGLRRLRDGVSMGVLGFTRETVALDAVRVGRDHLLGGLGFGLEIAREARTHTQLAVGAACVGGLKRCLQLAGRGGHYSMPVDSRITPNPLTLSRLGSIATRVSALECLVHRTARAIDAGHAVPAEAFAACRVLGPELLLCSVNDLIQLGGAVTNDADSNSVLGLYRDAGLVRNFDGPSEAIAEATGATLLEADASLRFLVQEAFGAPELVRWIGPLADAIRDRMRRLTGALARRSQRWADTRAGELTMWLVLFAAVDASLRATPSVELERAHGWARAQLEQVLASVRSGTPSESATLEAADFATTLASVSQSIGGRKPESTGADSAQQDMGSTEPVPRARKESRDGAVARSERSEDADSMARELRSWTISWLAHRLQIPVSQVDAQRSFADHGLDSVASVELAKALSDKLGRDLDETALWNFATIDALVDHVVGYDGAAEAASAPEQSATRSADNGSLTSSLDEEIARLEQELKSRS
jgi:alkylation response protein AidB-like acyl-CoA dehydrogenase/acyl carrier protein